MRQLWLLYLSQMTLNAPVSGTLLNSGNNAQRVGRTVIRQHIKMGKNICKLIPLFCSFFRVMLRSRRVVESYWGIGRDVWDKSDGRGRQQARAGECTSRRSKDKYMRLFGAFKQRTAGSASVHRSTPPEVTDRDLGIQEETRLQAEGIRYDRRIVEVTWATAHYSDC